MNTIKMESEMIKLGSMSCIDLPQVRGQWKALVNAIMNRRVS
jgi:hypothetical protein